MESLKNLREQLDEIDREIVSLYERRMSICGQVGEYKVETGRKVFDREREKEKLQDVESMASSEYIIWDVA